MNVQGNYEEAIRFNSNANTCFNTNYDNFFQGLSLRTKETFFFTFIIQFILVSLMYIHVGQGIYWKVLFYASTAGLIGALIEHSTLAYICQSSKRYEHMRVVTFFIEEFFWIICEYAVPYLNLIKMEVISKGKAVRTIRIVIYLLLIPFSAARLYDGYDRMMKGYLNTEYSGKCHGIAFGVMAIADIICTIFIIYFIKSNNKKGILHNTSITSYIKNSSYTILICVDIVSLILSILYIVSSIIFPENKDLESSTSLFHCLKSVFILILATDAMIFKYGVNNAPSTPIITNSNFKTSPYHNDYFNSTYKSYGNLMNNNTSFSSLSIDRNKTLINSRKGSEPSVASPMNASLPSTSISPPSIISPVTSPVIDKSFCSNISQVKEPSAIATPKIIPRNYTETTISFNEDQGYSFQANDRSDLIFKGNGKK